MQDVPIRALREQFDAAFEKELGALQHKESTTKKWPELLNTIHSIALATFGKKNSKSHLWFEATMIEMTPVIEANHVAFTECKKAPTEKKIQTYCTRCRSKLF